LGYLLIVLPAGCTTLGGEQPQFRPNNKLTDTARALRDAAPMPAPVPRELAKELLPAYVVEPGDVLLIQPADLDSPVRLPGDQTVLLDGTVDLGRYGRPVVAGKTAPVIEGVIRELIRAEVRDVGPINVRLINRVSKVFYVLGEVNAPGAYPVAGRETVLDAIVTAGGLNSRASQQNIILSRPSQPDGCRIVLPVCYRNIVQLGDTTTNYQIQPGDRVFVPARGLFEDTVFDRKEKPPCGCGTHVPCVPDAPPEQPAEAPTPLPAPRKTDEVTFRSVRRDGWKEVPELQRTQSLP
jgi:protein involved in polysaccharide export with SLBB domain